MKELRDLKRYIRQVLELEELLRPVVVDDSFWEIDEENGSKILRIQLAKVNQRYGT